MDIIASGYSGECPYGEIAKNLEKISHNNKAWSTRKSDTGRNTFAVQSTHNTTIDDICKEMAKMRTELWLVLKQIGEGVEKIDVVNYLSKPPPPKHEFYYEENYHAVNEQTVVFQPSTPGSNKENLLQGQGNQCRINGNYNRDGQYV